MTAIRTLLAACAAVLLTACASPGSSTADPHAAHRAEAAAATAQNSVPDPRMQAMKDMHQKMMEAKTPEERQALMAEHMKAMQGGMAMMKDKSAMPADMAGRHQMMMQRMDMMQSMMEMMMQRMPPAPAKP